jgi:threonine aldolase
MKQHGALLAKGRLLGLQFDTLFTDDLYYSISKNAITTARAIKQGLAKKGYTFFIDAPTNQTLVILDNQKMNTLSEQGIHFDFWEIIDNNHTAVRFCTSWATTMEDVEALLTLL